MKRLLVAVSVALLASACGGGDKTCQDVANAVAACATKLGGTGGIDAATCNAASCPHKQAAINCIVALPCNDQASYNTAFTACLTSNGCN